MKNKFSWNLLLIGAGVFVGIHTLARLWLLGKCFASVDPSAKVLSLIFARGLFWDLVTYSYMMVGPLLYLTFLPSKLLEWKWHRHFLFCGFCLWVFAMLFDACAQSIFWDEFGVRYNFIAVDYLVYTNEVLGNIRESYPIFSILSVLAVLAMLVSWPFRSVFLKAGPTLPIHARIQGAALCALFPLVFFFTVKESQADFSPNVYVNELSKNGPYCFFAAFHQNYLDYEKFYLVQPKTESFHRLRELLGRDQSKFLSEDEGDLRRVIQTTGPEKRHNVLLVSIESLSAEYMEVFGNPYQITPHLDALCSESLFFKSLYATGTRTVRGLEAMSLCIPPTPGSSLLKRPANENLFSAGFLFKDRGYDTKFIYGGYGYFDNMNYFFANNGFEIRDRANLSREQISFSNVWGVCDEDLYDQALREADASHANGKPFFSLVMTTSNHRPYTFPTGKIVSGSDGRMSAIKYTDYAVHQLLEKAKAKPWFDNTLFVFIADHCASAAGRVEIPVAKYHIPCILYAPKILQPQVVTSLCSQIDLMPTLLGILNFSYTTLFFGQDVLKHPPERAFMGNYQTLGYLKGNSLLLLGPNQKVSCFSVTEFLSKKEEVQTPIPVDPDLLSDAVGYYQGASILIKQGLFRHLTSSEQGN